MAVQVATVSKILAPKPLFQKPVLFASPPVQGGLPVHFPSSLPHTDTHRHTIALSQLPRSALRLKCLREHLFTLGAEGPKSPDK